MLSHVSDMNVFSYTTSGRSLWTVLSEVSQKEILLPLLETQFFPSLLLLVTDLSLLRQYIRRCFEHFSEAADMLQNNEVLIEIIYNLQGVKDQIVFLH